MSSQYDFDLVILGAGPGGYVAAIRASQLGLQTCIIEKDRLGGICLNWGCIPSKSLLHQAALFSDIPLLEKIGVTVSTEHLNYAAVQANSRKAATKLSRGVAYLMKKNNVTVKTGAGVITDVHTVTIDNTEKVTGANIIIATGSSPVRIPGFEFDEETILSSTGALQLQSLPKSLAILGGGAIGVEFSYVFSSFGVEVHLIEMLDRILPLEDNEVVDVVVKALKKKGVCVYTGTKAESCRQNGDMYTVTLSSGNEQKEISVERILVAVGRSSNTKDIGLETVGIATERGCIPVGDYYQTAVPHIYAIGDVINTPLLAHVASREGEIAVEHIAGKETEAGIDPVIIPSAVYCEPQLASFGLTEANAADENIPFEKAVFPYRGAGKSIAIEKPDGLVKLLYHKETKEIIGAHIAGTDATEIIHELLVAKKANLLPVDIADTIHAHPSIAETIMESAKLAEGRAIHI